MVLHGLGTLSAFQHVGVNILTRRVGTKRFRTHGEVLSETGVSVAVATLEAGISYRALGASNKAVGFSKQARFDLSHQSVHVWRNQIYIVWVNNMPSQRAQTDFLAVTLFFRKRLLFFS